MRPYFALKKIRFLRVLPRIYDLKRSNKSYSVFTTFPNMSKNFALLPELADVSVLNRSLTSLFGLCRNQVCIYQCKELIFPFPVEDIGVEPMTLCLQSRCSSQLS